MTAGSGRVHVDLDLHRAPDGTSAVHVRRADDGTDLGTVWLTELPVVLEALLLADDEDQAGAQTGSLGTPVPVQDRPL